MKPELQRKLIRQVLDQLDGKTTHMVPETYREPAAAYTEPARLEREKALLFRRFPIGVGHESMLPEPGDYMTHDDTGVPILLVRTRRGAVKAFLNVCRHRGARLVSEERGSGLKSIVCPYHAWSYKLTGELAGITDPEGFPDLDKGAHGLVELPVGVRHGIVWVTPEPGPAPDLDAWLAPVSREIEDFGFEGYHFYLERRVERQANWKVMLDGFLEGYHFAYAHRDSAFQMYLDNQGVYDDLYPHVRYFIARRSIAALKDADPKSWNIRPHALMVHYVFPNTFVQTLADHMFVHTVYPAGTGSCVFRHQLFVEELPKDEKAKAHWDFNANLVFEVFEEDFRIAEGIQQGLAAGVAGGHEMQTFGRYEQGLHYAHRAIDAALSGDLTVPLAAETARAAE